MIKIKTPLRLSLLGGGTDLDTYTNKFSGCVINTTISLYSYCTLEKIEKNIIFESLDENKKIETNINKKLTFNGELDLLKGVYNRILNEFRLTPVPFKLITWCDVPIGSGLGGSSSMVVSLIKVFLEFFNLSISYDKIALLAYEIEKYDMEFSVGKQDHYSASFTGFNFIEFYKDKYTVVNPIDVSFKVQSYLESSIILYCTKIKRSESISSLHQKINIESLHNIKEKVFKLKKSFLENNIDEIFKILEDSWNLKNKVINSKINEIAILAYNYGAKSVKLSGAGGGGFMLFLVDRKGREELINKLNQEGGGEVIDFVFIKEEF